MSPSFAPRLLMTLTLCQTCTELFGCPTGWPEYNKHCYFFGNDRKSWWDARLECASKGAHLASILDQREQDWLQSLKKGARAWIGLRRETTGRPWQWADATPFYYSAWNGGEPNNLGGKENCVEMWPLGHWNDFPCALNLKSYICKREYRSCFVTVACHYTPKN
ncbi:perlucin-like protein [Syngnathus acus]|uniref:perlucin-like protein n=1 Tax=Syngnathus acus TaxID=161584 RepID=UPI001885FC2D|nr:perlucin-like protein [Syngnathus acus]